MEHTSGRGQTQEVYASVRVCVHVRCERTGPKRLPTVFVLAAACLPFLTPSSRANLCLGFKHLD